MIEHLTSVLECSCNGEMIGSSDDEVQTRVQLEGCHDTVEFWTQKEALGQLQFQILAAISEVAPPSMPERSLPMRDPLPNNKPSLFGRKHGRLLGQRPEPQSGQASIFVDVKLDEIYFRKESNFGLLETVSGRVVVVSVEVK